MITLSHQISMEEFLKTREDLKQHIISLKIFKDQPEPITNSQKDLIIVIKPKIRMPMQVIDLFIYLHVDSNISEGHKYIISIMHKSNNIRSKLMDEILKFSRPNLDSLHINFVIRVC